MERYCLCLLLVFPLALSWGATEDAVEAIIQPQPVHSAGLGRQAIEIRRLFLNENVEALPGALRDLKANCRELKQEDGERYSAQGVAYTQGLHRAINRTRELVAADDLENADIQYEWVLRACTGCHQTTRELGLGPAKPLP